MAAIDYGPNKLAVTASGTTALSTHSPGGVRWGALNPSTYTGTLVDYINGSSLSSTIAGTTRSLLNPPTNLKLGMFKSGRLTVSSYVPPTPTWKPKIIIC